MSSPALHVANEQTRRSVATVQQRLEEVRQGVLGRAGALLRDCTEAGIQWDDVGSDQLPAPAAGPSGAAASAAVRRLRRRIWRGLRRRVAPAAIPTGVRTAAGRTCPAAR